jgi:hypothetical protein
MFSPVEVVDQSTWCGHDVAVTDDEVWVSGEFPKVGVRGLTRLARDGEDWIVTALVLVGSEINSQTLKGLPLGAITLAMRTDKQLAEQLSKRQTAQVRGLSQVLDTALTQAARVDQDDWQPPPRERLSRPTGADPDGHARAVAAAYEEAVRLGKSPGPTIAEEAGVPVATARGWIQEARRRGHLAKGRRGRAG